MLKIPGAEEFGGKSDIPANVTQSQWLTAIKNQACVGCHQLGQLSTRTIPAAFGTFKTSEEAWARRIQSGQGGAVYGQPDRQLGGVPLQIFRRLDRPHRATANCRGHEPPRPRASSAISSSRYGIGAGPTEYFARPDLHRQARSDGQRQRQATGSPEYSTDQLPILDPERKTVTYFTPPVRDPAMPRSLGDGHAAAVEAGDAARPIGGSPDLGYAGQQPQR